MNNGILEILNEKSINVSEDIKINPKRPSNVL
jgi:hypothetical protein